MTDEVAKNEVAPAQPKPETNGNSKPVDEKKPVVLSEQAAARVEEIMRKIAAQIEFYLGDFNLATDQFFRDLAGKDDGWVTIDTFMKCNRVKKFTSNADDVLTSLKKFSTKFDIDEEGKKVKRKEKYVQKDPAAEQADRDDRTVHVKRFTRTATVDTINQYFSQFGPVEGFVQNKFGEMDGKLKGKFKGSIDCIFVNKADAEAFLAAPAEKTQFDGRDMRRQWKKDYITEREKRMVDKREEIEKSKIPGSVLHISSTRAVEYIPIKEFFDKHSPVRFVDHQKGQKEARIRFQAGVAKEVLDNILQHNNNKLVVDGKQFKARVLEGKEEERYFATYWDTYLETKNNKIMRDMRNDPKFKFNPPKSAATTKAAEPEKEPQETPAEAEGSTEIKQEAEESRPESPSRKRAADEEESETKKPKVEETTA